MSDETDKEKETHGILDTRPLAEQYQFTQGDTIVAREHQKELERQKKTKRKHWFFSVLVLLAFLFVILVMVN